VSFVRKSSIAALVMFLSMVNLASAAELSEITNYIEYSPSFSSAGQPGKEQIKLLRADGFERVIYIALTNTHGAIADEDVIVKELGMNYIQIPVIWDAPTQSDYYAFAAAMQQQPEQKTLLHCQFNYRASAFSFLYRVLHNDVAVGDAKADMNSIWQPNEVWTNLIIAVLEENGISPDCDVCDWTIDE